MSSVIFTSSWLVTAAVCFRALYRFMCYCEELEHHIMAWVGSFDSPIWRKVLMTEVTSILMSVSVAKFISCKSNFCKTSMSSNKHHWRVNHSRQHSSKWRDAFLAFLPVLMKCNFGQYLSCCGKSKVLHMLHSY